MPMNPRSIDEKIIADLQKRRPEAPTSGGFFQGWHFKCFADLALPDSAHMKNSYLLGVSPKNGEVT
jgi:hypothetical protein